MTENGIQSCHHMTHMKLLHKIQNVTSLRNLIENHLFASSKFYQQQIVGASVIHHVAPTVVVSCSLKY